MSIPKQQVIRPEVISGEIMSGFRAWRSDPARAGGELEFGAWWRLEEVYWRMAWIEATQELYAAKLAAGDRFIVLGQFAKKEVVELLRKWYDGDNLQAFVQRLQAPLSPEPKAQAPI